MNGGNRSRAQPDIDARFEDTQSLQRVTSTERGLTSLSAFAADVPGHLLAAYATCRNLPGASQGWADLSGRSLGQAFDRAYEKLGTPLRDTVYRDMEACERVSKGGRRAVLLPACADDLALRGEINALTSNRARALCLFLHNKPADSTSLVFDRAELLFECGAHHQNGQTWRAYSLKGLARDWSPRRNARANLKRTALQVLEQRGDDGRDVEVEGYVRPAGDGVSAQDNCYSFVIHVSDADETGEAWVEGVRQHVPRTPNRRLVFCITPINKMIEAGHQPGDADLANSLLEAIARDFLEEKSTPSKLQSVPVRLTGLDRRRTWPTLSEFKIQSVEVKKLVVRRGPGTRTYYVPGNRKGDAYDVAPPNIPGGAIMAAGLRVVFDKGAFGARTSSVQFELSLPNRCTLRESREADRFILETCLQEWGLRASDEPEGELPLAISPDALPFARLIDASGTSLPAELVEDWLGDGFRTLFRLQVLVPEKEHSNRDCPRCPLPHPLQLLPSGRKWIGICEATGPVEFDDDAPAHLQLDMNALALQLCFSLSLESEAPKALLEKQLYYLGQCSGAPDWTAFFAPTLEGTDLVNTICRRLETFGTVERGVILTSSEVPQSLVLPGKHAVLRIDEAVSLVSGRLLTDDARIKAALDRKSLGRRRPGRTSLNKLAQSIARKRKQLKVRSTSAKKEIDAIKQTIFQLNPAADFPSFKTIRYEWLKDHFEDWDLPETD